jgi:nucleoside phosphorylase
VTLLVAATERELCGHAGLVCGVGPVEAAAATARALALERPRRVLHVGVAGARGLAPGTLVVGTESLYLDVSAGIPLVSWVEPDAGLLAAARTALPEALAGAIATTGWVGRLRGSEPRSVGVEAMEGFAVLRACALAGVPAVEMRAVSNELGEEDRSRWELERALSALAAAVPRLLAALGE